MNQNILKTSLKLLFLLVINVSAQLPESRSYEWNRVNHINNYRPENTVEIFSNDLNSEFNQAEYIQFIIDKNENCTILLPEGDYYLDKGISLKSNMILSGNANGTKLIFDMNVEEDPIRLNGKLNSSFVYLSKQANKGDRIIEVDNQIEADFIKISFDDSELVTSNWAIGSVGQILTVDSISGNKLYLFEEISHNYPVDAQIRAIDPIQNSGVKCLSIEFLTESERQLANINFSYANNCFVEGINSTNCIFSHVRISNSSYINVKDSYFFDGLDHGGGGRAYGVAIQYSSNYNLVYNNIFERLRHSVLFQAGSNSNVVSYNYSFNPFWTGVSLPQDSAGDLVLHGNYVFGNLFESNVVQNIVIDDSHGANGPDNVFFRNRAENYGIFMNFNPPSNSQVFIANEVTNNGFLKGLYALQGTNHIEIANNIKGELVPTGSEMELPNSLYLESKPNDVNIEKWPAVGYPNTLSSFTIEAEEREDYYYCRNITLNINEVYFELDSDIRIYSIEGKFIKTIHNINELELDTGLYLFVQGQKVDKVFISN